MSIGITILKNLVTITSKNFSDNCDVEISEIHHKMKRDIPSRHSYFISKFHKSRFR